jgi:hypothetical protein
MNDSIRVMSVEMALRWCGWLWTWITEDHGRRKRNFPKWDEFLAELQSIGVRLDLDDLEYEAYCPCCVFVFLNKTTCRECPMSGLWGTDEIACIKKHSPYYEWSHSVFKQEAAALIRDHAIERWRELNDRREFPAID